MEVDKQTNFSVSMQVIRCGQVTLTLNRSPLWRGDFGYNFDQ